MAGVLQKKLIELNADISNALVTALVLSKSEPNFFLSKDTNEYRGVITYTLRDSKRHIVNCKYWGTKEKVDEYHRKLKIGDVIDVICPKVLPHITLSHFSAAYNGEEPMRYQPTSTLPITLALNEGEGLMDKHNYCDMDSYRELRNLLRIPHKPLCNALNLADVRNSTSENIKPQLIDLLVAIASLRPARELKSARTGKMLNCLELIVFDRSLVSGMILTTWNSDWIKRAEQYWHPSKTVLHLVDVKVFYSSFHKSSSLSVAGCTLIYENPIGEEAQLLAEFAITAPSKELNIFAQTGSGNLPQADQITNQMTVKQIYARIEGHLKDDSEQFTAVLYAMVTKFDIDGQQNQVISKKCKSCHRFLTTNQVMCESDQCQLSFSLNYSGDTIEYIFNISIQFSDHTGTLVEARVSGGSGSDAERVLGVGIKEFLQMQEHQKDTIKWLFLMNHFEVKLLIRKVTPVRRNLAIIIINMRAAQLNELAQKILVF